MSKVIAYQGCVGAHSYIACRRFYEDHEPIAHASFSQVFAAVESGEAKYGIIPLENSYAGRVAEIHNLLHSSNLSIVAEHFLPISHNLSAIKGAKIEDVIEIISHPQALMQCQNSLRAMNKTLKEFSNTAKAAQYVASQKSNSIAALCSAEAAKVNDLEILQPDLQDQENDNTTVFIIVAKEGVDPDLEQGKVLTTMLFTIRNITGSLYKALGGFATNNVNMVKLESYIPGGMSRQAKFFITIEGHPSQRNVSLALEELGFFSRGVRLIGVYYADKSRN